MLEAGLAAAMAAERRRGELPLARVQLTSTDVGGLDSSAGGGGWTPRHLSHLEDAEKLDNADGLGIRKTRSHFSYYISYTYIVI